MLANEVLGRVRIGELVEISLVLYTRVLCSQDESVKARFSRSHCPMWLKDTKPYHEY